MGCVQSFLNEPETHAGLWMDWRGMCQSNQGAEPGVSHAGQHPTFGELGWILQVHIAMCDASTKRRKQQCDCHTQMGIRP